MRICSCLSSAVSGSAVGAHACVCLIIAACQWRARRACRARSKRDAAAWCAAALAVQSAYLSRAGESRCVVAERRTCASPWRYLHADHRRSRKHLRPRSCSAAYFRWRRSYCESGGLYKMHQFVRLCGESPTRHASCKQSLFSVCGGRSALRAVWSLT